MGIGVWASGSVMYQTTPDEPLAVVSKLCRKHSSESVHFGQFSITGNQVRRFQFLNYFFTNVSPIFFNFTECILVSMQYFVSQVSVDVVIQSSLPSTLTSSHRPHRRARQQQSMATQEQHFHLVRERRGEGKEREGERGRGENVSEEG